MPAPEIKPEQPWYQFSLRSLFVVMFLACIGMSWIGVKMQQARQQSEAVDAIEKVGGKVSYDEGFFRSVVLVSFPCEGTLTDADLEHLEGLTELRELIIGGYEGLHCEQPPPQYPTKQVTDVGLEHLKGLTNLRYLDLKRTKVTNEGVMKLQQALPNCKITR